MRLVAPLLMLCVLAACGDRRSFDQRYSDTSRKLEEKARELDANLAAAEAAENEAAPER